MPFNLTMSELAVVLVLALIFLGPKKLPELASGLGKMIREIKKVTAGVKEEIQLDENVRKPFEELREALTLPAEELKRRDEWKAEWEKRQAEDEAQAAANPEANADSETGDHTHHNFGEDDHTELHVDHDHGSSDVPAPHSSQASAFEPTSYAGSSVSDQTIANVPAPALADKTVIAPAPVAPDFTPAPRLPTAPPPGAVASGRTMMGVSPTGLPARPLRPTPPPPPAASRLPIPKVAARVVPKPEAPAETATPSSDDTNPKA